MANTETTQFGRYELLERIGVGGMAEVWKARVAGLGGFEKILVLKKILPEFAQNKTFVEMLLNEARLCAILQHANIVQTYENGEIDGNYYIAMEYVQGQDLFKVLSQVTKVDKRIPINLCLYVAAEVAKGLAYAHGAKDHSDRPLHIIHRDVSPSNVLLSNNGEVKVMDFGVARATMDGVQNDDRSRAGVLKGKLGYMSPEQVTGQPFDFRSDIFSLGIILYESITLKRLFLGRTDLETLVNIRDARIEHKFRKHSYIEEPVRAILRKALARNPDDRYASALDFHDDIINLLFQQKTHITNRTLGAFLTELFAEPKDDDDSDTADQALGVASNSQNSLTFSPEEMRRQQSEIRRRRAEQESLRRASAVAPGAGLDASAAQAPGAELNVAQNPINTTVELNGVPARRTSRQVSMQTAGAGGQQSRAAMAQTTPDSSSGKPFAVGAGAATPSSRSSGSARPAVMVGGRSRSSGRSPKASKVGVFAASAESSRPDFRLGGSRFVAVPRRASGAGVLAPRRRSSGAGLSLSMRRVSTSYLLRSGDDHVLGPMSRDVLESMVRNRSAGLGAQVAVEDGPFHAIEEFSKLHAVIKEIAALRGEPDRRGESTRLSFPRLVYRIYADRSTGCLELQRDDAVKSIYFRKGRPTHIASNQMVEMLGPFLISQGIVSERDVNMAVAASYQGQGRLGDVLVAMNFIKPYQLYQVLEKQFSAKFIEAFGWEEASWAFFIDEKPPSTVVPLDLDPISALVEGVRSKVPLSILEPFFDPDMDRTYHRLPGARVTIEGLRLQAREAKAHGLIMASQTLREVVEERCRSRQQHLAILHVMLLLTQTGLLGFDDPA